MNTGIHIFPKKPIERIIGVLVLVIMLMSGCASPNQRLLAAISNNNATQVDQLLAGGKCDVEGVRTALAEAIDNRNHAITDAILEHAKQCGSTDQIFSIPKGIILEYDEEYTAFRNDGAYYYKRVCAPVPTDMLMRAIRNGDETAARLLVEHGMPCGYDCFEDNSCSVLGPWRYYGPNMVVDDTFRGRRTISMWTQGRLTVKVPPGQVGSLSIRTSHAEAARQQGLDSLAELIEQTAKTHGGDRDLREDCSVPAERISGDVPRGLFKMNREF